MEGGKCGGERAEGDIGMPQVVLRERYVSVRMELDLLDSTERARGFHRFHRTVHYWFRGNGSLSVTMLSGRE